ncbi:nuclear transport factor 2 family protein [Amycolatopsis samaneae]|uniref:Nuclear transport factor 2 family protein n=1 Tax=Amycolatopsis samaneae TaxID=664691 RepID=A0ABW5GRX1_9PSEU
MATTPRPREIFAKVQESIQNGGRGEVADFYAEDAEVEHVFGVGQAKWRGREELRAFFDRRVSDRMKLKAHNTFVHETTDPEVIVAEWDYDLVDTETGMTVRLPNLVVMRIRDGLIVSSRDYHNHLALAAASGKLRDLVAMLENTDAA